MSDAARPAHLKGVGPWQPPQLGLQSHSVRAAAAARTSESPAAAARTDSRQSHASVTVRASKAGFIRVGPGGAALRRPTGSLPGGQRPLSGRAGTRTPQNLVAATQTRRRPAGGELGGPSAAAEAETPGGAGAAAARVTTPECPQGGGAGPGLEGRWCGRRAARSSRRAPGCARCSPPSPAAPLALSACACGCGGGGAWGTCFTSSMSPFSALILSGTAGTWRMLRLLNLQRPTGRGLACLGCIGKIFHLL